MARAGLRAIASGLAVAAGLAPVAWSASPESLTLTHAGVERTYLRYVPDRVARSSVKAPLVLVLHGGRGRAGQIMRYTGFNRLADRQGFVVVYPQGLNRQWSDGRPVNGATDDVGFLVKAVDAAVTTGQVDPARVFVAGISNGGFMALRLACDATARFAGVAAVTAQLTDYLSTRCRPSRPLPVLLLNGTEDPLVPYKGGVVAERFGGRGAVIPTDATLGFWAWRNGCQGGPRTARLPDRDPGDGTRIERMAWETCIGGARVVLYRVVGGGHTWPGKVQYLPERWIGRTSRDADGTELIWRFFAAVPKAR